MVSISCRHRQRLLRHRCWTRLSSLRVDHITANGSDIHMFREAFLQAAQHTACNKLRQLAVRTASTTRFCKCGLEAVGASTHRTATTPTVVPSSFLYIAAASAGGDPAAAFLIFRREAPLLHSVDAHMLAAQRDRSMTHLCHPRVRCDHGSWADCPPLGVCASPQRPLTSHRTRCSRVCLQ